MAKAFIVRDFKDAGTGANFTAETIREISAGAFRNYKAAGLVRVPTAAELKSAKASSADVD